MNNQKISLKTMRRGLAFFYISGIVQTFKEGDGWDFTDKARGRNGLMYAACEEVRLEFPDRRTLSFARGNLVYLPKGCRYKISFHGVDPNGYTDLQISFDIRDGRGEDYYIDTEPCLILPQTPEKVIRNMLDIADVTANAIYPSFPIKRLFGEMMETISSRLWLPEMQPGAKSRAAPAIYYMENHLCDDTPVSDLAKLCMLNETTFRKEFRKATGFTPARYRIELKIRKVQELLRATPEMPTGNLVETLGFFDTSYLYKTFRSVTGQSLKDFRKSCK